MRVIFFCMKLQMKFDRSHILYEIKTFWSCKMRIVRVNFEFHKLVSGLSRNHGSKISFKKPCKIHNKLHGKLKGKKIA